MDGTIESLGVGEGMVGLMVGFEMVPHNLDIVEFGRVFGQRFNGKAMGAGGKRRGRRLPR